MSQKERVRWGIMFLVLCLLGLGGCTMLPVTQDKIRDLEFTVMGEEKIPGELLAEIGERSSQAFHMAFSDGNVLYLVVGYGEQAGSGYRIAVEKCYLTESAIYVDTTLLGPEDGSKTQETSYPYIVLKTEKLDKTIIFQ